MVPPADTFRTKAAMNRLLPVILPVLLLSPVASPQSSAADYSPRVSRTGSADTLSLSTWAAGLGPAELSDRGYALRLLATVADPETGLQLSDAVPLEGPDKLSEFARVTDPVKLWHVYGYGDERQIAGVFVALWEITGRGRGRLVRAANSGLCFAEIESQGQWWAFDVVRRVAFPKDHGFASIEDLRQQETLWTRTDGDWTYPADLAGSVRQKLVAGPLEKDYDAVDIGYTADFVLRRGQRLICYATPQGQRWNLSPLQVKDKPLMKRLSAETPGPKAAGAGTVLHANATLVYEPKLNSEEFLADAAIVREQVQAADAGWTLKEAGTGTVILEVQSPYIIVPELGKLEDAKDDSNASVVEIDAANTTLSYSLDNGATWLTLEAKQFPARLDLTSQVTGCYSYLLRLELKGKPGEAVVKSLKITTWLQLSPRSLPRIVPGEQTFQVRRHDEFGRPTRVFSGITSTAAENSFLAPVIRPPREVQPGDASRRVSGPFTVRISPPLGTQLAWFRYGGRFAVDAQHPETGEILLGYQASRPMFFSLSPAPPLPVDHSGADRHYNEQILLGQRTKAAYARIEGRPALNDLRLVTHGVEQPLRETSPWNVTHRWHEVEEARESVVEITPTTTGYPVTAGPNVVNDSIEFHCP